MFSFPPVRDWLYLGLAVVFAIGVLSYNHHEREIGRAKLEQQIRDTRAEMQGRIDDLAAKQNHNLQERYSSSEFIPFDFKLPSNCGDVDDAVRMRVNAAHKTN